MDYQMGLEKLRALLPKDFPILKLNGPWLEFTPIPKPGELVEDYAAALKKDGLELDEGLVRVLKAKLPTGQLYVHQENAIKAILQGKNVVLPHPTGSGKTEAFVVPILQHLLQEIRQNKRYGLGCLMIFPMKALENDQRDRLKDLLFKLESFVGERIPFIGVYDGDTPSVADFVHRRENEKRDALRRYAEKCPRCGVDNLKFNMGPPTHLLRCDPYEDDRGNNIGCGYPEDATAGIAWIRTTREDMRNPNYPNLLITNPESLDFRLLSSEDRGVFQTKMNRVIVVIDEAHAYSAGSALSLRFLLSRLEEKVSKINGRKVEFQYVISSATLDDPKGFAHRLIPWRDFEVIPFVRKPSPFGTDPTEQWPLKSSLQGLDVEPPDWIFEAFGESPEQVEKSLGDDQTTGSALLEAILQFGFIKVDDGKLRPGAGPAERAWTAFEAGDRKRANGILREELKNSLAQVEQVSALYELASSKPHSMEMIVNWWEKRWPGWPAAKIEANVAALVLLGRRLGLWEERWHVFVRPPTGMAGCNALDPHIFPLSSDEPLPARCKKCAYKFPVFELWTCQDCGEVHFVLYVCKVCGSVETSRDAACTHADKRVLVTRMDHATEQTDPAKLEDALFDPDDGCDVCDGRLLPVRRRTDLIIEMAVSLVGWHTDQLRRKFLLFTDSRAASERIGREFNNLEELLWAERLLMDVMLRDPNFAGHDARLWPEVRRKLFARLFRPYNVGLKGLLRRYEQDLLERKLVFAAFRSLGRSVSGQSRLFEHGLLSYAFDEMEPKIKALELEEVLPRVADIVRMRASRDTGIKHDRLVKRFLKGHDSFTRHMKSVVAPHEEKIDRSLDVLEEGGWIRRIKTPGEVRIFFNEGDSEASDDPFAVARDLRKVRVPTQVSHCPNCGLVRWYTAKVCERCGTAMGTRSHEELLGQNYFSEILVKEPRPIVAAIHRAGIEPLERRAIEERFRAPENSIHFLCATPTLELGIDVGYLNFVLLARVPPTKTNYIQRVGRAGRRRNEGAICVTFVYPSPIDAYYFRNPESLVAMRTGRLPVQRLSRDHLRAFLLSAMFDAIAFAPPHKSDTMLSPGATAREFLEGQLPYSLDQFRTDLGPLWETSLRAWMQAVAGRCLIEDADRATGADVRAELEAIKSLFSDPKRFGEELFQVSSFAAQKEEVDRLHLAISQGITDLRAKKARNNDENDELEKLETEDRNLQEYKKRNMVGSPILMYLHDLGTISSPRGIGGSVVTYDLALAGRTLDDRVVDQALSDRFPGAYLSRQGMVYRIRQMVYDPIDRPSLRTCTVCDRWLADDATSCPEHAGATVDESHLEKPIVGFGDMAGLQTRETRGNREERIRALIPPDMGNAVKLGKLPIRLSAVQGIEIATLCKTYDLLQDGRRIALKQPLEECASCHCYTTAGFKCCRNPSPRAIVQGTTYEARGVRFELDDAFATSKIAHLPPDFSGPDPLGVRNVTQSLANALLNALSIKLDIEPSMLDATLDSDDSFWIFEPTAGGFGLLEDVLQKPSELQSVLVEVQRLVATQPGIHQCARYCDQCLIIPRYSHDELRLLHRPLLELVLGSADE